MNDYYLTIYAIADGGLFDDVDAEAEDVLQREGEADAGASEAVA